MNVGRRLGVYRTGRFLFCAWPAVVIKIREINQPPAARLSEPSRKPPMPSIDAAGGLAMNSHPTPGAGARAFWLWTLPLAAFLAVLLGLVIGPFPAAPAVAAQPVRAQQT